MVGATRVFGPVSGSARPENLPLAWKTERVTLGEERLTVRLRGEGIQVDAVRLDSGDLASLSVQVREILDRGGCPGVRIFCSGGLDEYALKPLLDGGCPIDGFGIGTSLDVSADAPFLDCVYKLQEYAGQGRRKRDESADSLRPAGRG